VLTAAGSCLCFAFGLFNVGVAVLLAFQSFQHTGATPGRAVIAGVAWGGGAFFFAAVFAHLSFLWVGRATEAGPEARAE
jgi:hypothetical protein